MYPVGVPIFFGYLLLVRFRGPLEKQRDKEQLAYQTKSAAKHVDRLHERKEKERKSSKCLQPRSAASSHRRQSVGHQVVAKLHQTNLVRVSASEKYEDAEADAAGGEETTFGTTAVWKETTAVLVEIEAPCETTANRTPGSRGLCVAWTF